MTNNTSNNNDNLISNISDERTENNKPATTGGHGSIEGFSLSPRNLKEALKICDILSQSNFVPKEYRGKPGDILVCINKGMEIGLKPLQALESIAVVNGRATLWGAAPLALARQHPEFEWILEDNEAFAYARDNVKGWEHLKDKNPDDTSICVVKRKGEPPVVREFSKQDVEKAGLGNVHKNYPKDMRKYRARSRGLEASFSDAIQGFRQYEVEKENQQMIEEGYWDDFDAPEPSQKVEDRQEVDIDQVEEEVKDEKQPEKAEKKKTDIDKEIAEEQLPFN